MGATRTSLTCADAVMVSLLPFLVNFRLLVLVKLKSERTPLVSVTVAEYLPVPSGASSIVGALEELRDAKLRMDSSCAVRSNIHSAFTFS